MNLNFIPMKLVIRNFEYMQGREGVAVNCDFAFKGKIFLHAHDDGNGGCLDYYVYPNTPENQLVFNQFKAYVDGLPEYDFNAEMKAYGYDMGKNEPDMRKKTVEDVLNEFIDEAIGKKEQAQFNRDAKKGIVYGKDKYRYSKIWWKGTTLAKMVMSPKGKLVLQTKLNQIKKELNDGEKILNAEYLKSLGITI